VPRQPFIPLDQLDPDHPVMSIDDIRSVNQQRYEMEQLSAILLFDPDAGLVAGVKEVTQDEFWVRGHIPGRPLLPGVLMIEASAQLCSLYYGKAATDMEQKFIGFGGVDGVKFRGQVVPGDTLILIASKTEMRSRRAKFDVQAFVGDKMVFEGVIIGMPM
jgi:3-hydroxyacyl-[acyl-carrier-protein] dehydratase